MASILTYMNENILSNSFLNKSLYVTTNSINKLLKIISYQFKQ